MNQFKKICLSVAIPKIIIVLAVLLVFLLVFQAGFAVGFRKAAFSFNWDKNYMTGGFDDPRSFMAPFMRDIDDVNPHGAVGEIISIRLPSILVKRSSGAEEVINIGPMTSIRNLRLVASTSDLALHKQVIVIGEANDSGQIDASLIRILPPQSFSSTTSAIFIPPMMRSYR
jgi:hypothetical protein